MRLQHDGGLQILEIIVVMHEVLRSMTASSGTRRITSGAMSAPRRSGRSRWRSRRADIPAGRGIGEAAAGYSGCIAAASFRLTIVSGKGPDEVQTGLALAEAFGGGCFSFM